MGGAVMTAQVKRLPVRKPDEQARCAKYDEIGNRLRNLAQELGVIYWAAFGLGQVISDGEKLSGIEHLAGRLMDEIEAIADEVRL